MGNSGWEFVPLIPKLILFPFNFHISNNVNNFRNKTTTYYGLWRKLSAQELMLLNGGVGEDSWESLGDCKEIQPVNSKADQFWVFIGRNYAKAETPILWPPHEKSWLTGKDPDAGRDWGQDEKGTTEDEIAGWHHQLDGHEFEWTPGVGDGQGGLACWNSWGRKESDMTERLNSTELYRGKKLSTQAKLPEMAVWHGLVERVLD